MPRHALHALLTCQNCLVVKSPSLFNVSPFSSLESLLSAWALTWPLLLHSCDGRSGYVFTIISVKLIWYSVKMFTESFVIVKTLFVDFKRCPTKTIIIRFNVNTKLFSGIHSVLSFINVTLGYIFITQHVNQIFYIFFIGIEGALVNFRACIDFDSAHLTSKSDTYFQLNWKPIFLRKWIFKYIFRWKFQY